jgi:hypothetical protein
VKKAETKGEKPEIEDEKKKQTAGELFKHSQQAVKQAMVSSVKSTMDPSNFKYSEMQELAVTAINHSEILKHQKLLTLSLESRTRSVAS